jgi:hypothetical protein
MLETINESDTEDKVRAWVRHTQTRCSAVAESPSPHQPLLIALTFFHDRLTRRPLTFLSRVCRKRRRNPGRRRGTICACGSRRA